MNLSITLYPYKTRVITFYDADDKSVPSALAENKVMNIDFVPNFPVPFAKKDITVGAKYGDVYWLGSDKGVMRYCESEREEYDKVMYFSADRDLKDNKVLALCGDENGIWVRTETAVSHIELRVMSMEEKANMLLEETLTIVQRLGMVSQRGLAEPWNKSKPEPFTDSDNDGGFTAAFCLGELFHYAVLRREKGADDEETKRVRAVVIRSLEACLLLMFIAGRGDGFVARTYITTDHPLPDDGLFFRKQGGKATVIETSSSIDKGYAGMTCDASVPVPDRLAKLYRDAGYTDDDIIFKGDTSSDETTLHLVLYYFAHAIIGSEDEELDGLMKTAVSGLVDHILRGGHELIDFHGGSTSWGKWSERYFNDGIGWCDAPLNSNELLMYLKVANEVCGEQERWTAEYDKLVEKGYPELSKHHFDRAFAQAVSQGCDVDEDLMYGDHMLSNLTFYMLHVLEDDEKLRKYYHEGWLTWRESSVAREHHPIYDLPYMLVRPERAVNEEKIKMWFYRHNSSMLASGISLSQRRDVAAKEYIASYKQTSYLLPPDERAISKYDRDSLHYVDEESRGKITVETCCPYTLPYWFGRYFGLLTEGGNA